MFKPFCDCTIILFYEATQTSLNKIWMPLCIFYLLTKKIQKEAKPLNMTERSNGRRITRWKQLCWENTTSTGAEMLPALLLCFCRIIKQAGAAEEAEAAHSYQLSHTWGGHSLCPQQDTNPNTKRSCCTLKLLLDFWSTLGFWSAHLVKLHSIL